MPQSQFTPVWDALSPDLRRQLLQHPALPLASEHVDELVAAGGRSAHALWFDSRPGHPRRWATSWEFRRFVEQHRDAESVSRPAPDRDRSWLTGGRERGRRLPMMPG